MIQFQKPIQQQRTINADISRENYGSTVAAIQGDGDDRCVHVRLLDNGVAWTPPAQTWAEVRYVKPDGTVGLYDMRADGRPAVFVRGAEATVFLASQMLTVPGIVKASVAFLNSQMSRVTTFPFTVTVEKDIFAGAQKSEDFIKLQWLEDQLDEHLKQAKESGMFNGPQGKPFTYGDFTPEQLAALTGPQGPQGDNTAALEAAQTANAAASTANEAAAAAQAVVDTVVPDVNQLKATKIDKPATPPESAGKVLRVLSVNADGTFTCEWADSPSGVVIDAQINGVSVVNDGVANFPLGNSGKFGFLRPIPSYGMTTWGDGQLGLTRSDKTSINNRVINDIKPISLGYLDYAVKAAMCDGKGDAWTDTERIAALLRIGCTVDDNGIVRWTAQEVEE